MKVVQMINQSKDQIKQLDKDESTLNKLIQNQRNENAKINLQLAEKERQHQEVILKLKSHQNILDTQDETWANQQEQKKIQENNMKDLIRQVQQENSQNEKELRECQNGNSINLNRKNQLEKELKNCKSNKQILATNSANSNIDSQLRTCRAKLAQTNIQSLTLQVENCKKESTNCNNNWHQCEKDKESNASKKVLAQAAADQCKLQRGAIASQKGQLSKNKESCSQNLVNCLLNKPQSSGSTLGGSSTSWGGSSSSASQARSQPVIDWTDIYLPGQRVINRRWALFPVPEGITGGKALQKCNQIGATLAKINNKDVRKSMYNYIMDKTNDHKKDYWVDSVFDIKNDKGCMSIDADEHGWSYNCQSHKENGYICEMK